MAILRDTYRHSSARPLLWVALGAALWGTDTVLRRPLTVAFTSIQIVLIEHLILTAVLLPLCGPWWRKLTPAQWGAVLGIAWGGSALGTLCFTEAIRLGNPTTAVLLQKTQPVIAVLLAKLILREPLGKRLWIPLAIAMAGAYLISFGDDAGFANLRHFGAAGFGDDAGFANLRRFGAAGFGDGAGFANLRHFGATGFGAASPAGLALAAATLWGASTVLGRFALGAIPFQALTALRIVVALPLLIALALSQPHAWPAPHPRQWVALAALALVPGLLALLIYYRGLRQTRASLAAVAELSFPATAALLNWTILGAGVSPVQIAGFAILWAAILAL